jgi:hypothetical protein
LCPKRSLNDDPNRRPGRIVDVADFATVPASRFEMTAVRVHPEPTREDGKLAIAAVILDRI